MRANPLGSVVNGAIAAFAIAGLVSCTYRQSGHRVDHVGGAAKCSRQCLILFVDQYLASLPLHDPSRLPLAASVKFTQNGRSLRVGEGLWQTAGALGSYRVYVIDPDSSAAAVQTVLHDGSNVVQLLLRLKVIDNRISEIETLVAREGDTCCWAPERLDALPPTFDRRVPGREHVERNKLIGVADAYFTALHTAGTPEYRGAPVGVGMNRYENGKQTTNVVLGANRITRWDARTQLDSAMFGAISVVNRRYPVVDPENGTMLGIVLFQYPTSNRPSEIIAELFKITGGEIREIRAVMVKQASSGWN